ncbi:MAG TPA: M14 family metallopeptidase, partial [Planctomycetota bacterium]|nr:M14 family metallopeptidase [Planctomycetota bacterium]
MSASRLPLVTVIAAVLAGGALAQDFPFLPESRHDPAIPTFAAVIGRPLGEEPSTHAEAERYLQALARASDRLIVERYGTSWEGRPLYNVLISAPANLARRAEVQAGMQRLADPRGLDEAGVEPLLRTLPAVAWLIYNVHGDEPSGTDAALAVAYHLCAALEDPLVDAILGECVTMLDPVQNPDGRDRFVLGFRGMRGRQADPEPDAAEHQQAWPGGRSNHYWFDLNRDWFGMTQPETRARVRLFHEWWPLVVADLHEMGGNSTYFFAPPAEPVNPEVTLPQRRWLERYGRNNATWFDRFGIAYFTRENYDCFYPGYGEGWPLFQGSIGMTYEQGSVRGQRFRREDDVEVHYRDCVRNHFLASLATLETLARNRHEALTSFLDYRRSAIREGGSGPVREYLFPPGKDPQRTAQLMALLAAQGIDVRRAAEELRNARTRDYYGGAEAARTFPAGTFVVPLAQPQKRLAHVLLVAHLDMGAEFLAEQHRRYHRREDTDFYDLTAWSLPLLWDVECYSAADSSQGRTEPVDPATLGVPRADAFAPARVAYLVPWGTLAAPAAVARLMAADVRVHCAARRFTQAGRTYRAGTAIVRVAEHHDPAALHATMLEVAAQTGAEIVPTDTGWVDQGVALGSNDVRFVRKAKIALLCDRPADSYSTGWARWLLEQVYGLPVTMVRTRHVARARLDRYTTIVIPDGTGYTAELGPVGVQRLKAWVQEGGTLVTLGDATQWLTEKDVGLLASAREFRRRPVPRKDGAPPRPGEDGAAADAPPERESPPAAAAGTDRPPAAEPGARGADEAEPFDYERAIQPDQELPVQTPGAILRVRLDPDHWVAFGYDGGANVVVGSRNVFTPIKLDRGVNVAVYEARDRLLLAGFSFGDKL